LIIISEDILEIFNARKYRYFLKLFYFYLCSFFSIFILHFYFLCYLFLLNKNKCKIFFFQFPYFFIINNVWSSYSDIIDNLDIYLVIVNLLDISTFLVCLFLSCVCFKLSNIPMKFLFDCTNSLFPCIFTKPLGNKIFNLKDIQPSFFN